MVGHSAHWREMIVLGLYHGDEAAGIETSLIRWALDIFAAKCRNVARDSRGLGPEEPAFIYVVLK